MNFHNIKEVDEFPLDDALRPRLDGLVDYLQQKIEANAFDYLPLATIAQDTGLAVDQLLTFGSTPADLIHHIAYRLNQQMIDRFMNLHLLAMGFETLARVKAYLLMLYKFDIEHIKLRGAIMQYAWSWSFANEERINNQYMKLMAPVYLEFMDSNMNNIDGRCHAVWALYQRGLRLAALRKASAEDCLNDITPALVMICDSRAV
jgi:hypothetical protein